jgi:hypothetical protein
MDQAAKTKLGAEQLAGLSRLKLGLAPPGVRPGRTIEDTVLDARTKYYSHIWDSLRFFFPRYCRHRPPGFKKLVAMFDELELESDQFANLDAMFTTLLGDVRRLSRPDAWHDLLLIERAIAKSRIAPRVADGAKRIERRLRAIRIGPSRIADRDGVFFVALRTDLITAFGYPGKDPRRARPARRTIRAAIFRRPGTNRPELTWLA